MRHFHKRRGPCPARPFTDLDMSCHKTAGLGLVWQYALGLVQAGFNNSEPLDNFCTRRRSSHCLAHRVIHTRFVPHAQGVAFKLRATPLMAETFPLQEEQFFLSSTVSVGQAHPERERLRFRLCCQLPRQFCWSTCFLCSAILTAACSERAYEHRFNSNIQ